MKVIFNITQNKFNSILNQETTEIKVSFKTGYYPLPVGLENYYTKNETDLLLENYYTKTETYSQTQIDNFVSNLELEIDNKANLSDVYLKTETYNQIEINGFLSGKQNTIGYTPENSVNKSDSYTNSSSVTYSSTKALVDGLANKLDKGTYTGTAQDLKNSIDSKLNKPTTTSNTASYPFVVGEDGNGNPARLPAGDLGKNFFNSDLKNTTARNHTMNAGVTINTLGNPHTLSGLPNKNADIANFRKVRVQNTSGLDAVVDSKNLLTDGMTSMSDAEKDAWRLAQRKTNETYSTGQPRVDFILPKIIKNENFNQYVTLYGLNLLLDIANCEVKLVNTTTKTEYLISTIQTYANNPQMLTFGYNFSTLPIGTYRIKIRNGNLINIDTTTFSLVNSIVELPINLTWTFLNNTNTIGASDSVSSNSFGLINDTATGVQTIKSSTLISAIDAAGNFILTFNINTDIDTWQSTKYVGLLNSTTLLNSSTIIEFGYKNTNRFHNLFPTSATLGSGQDTYLKGNVTFSIIKEGNLITMIENVGGDIKINAYQLLHNINYDLALLGYNSNVSYAYGHLFIDNLKLYKL